jgi:hypothetical protein
MNAPGYTASAPASNDARKFLENVLVWPGSPQAPGWINVHVNAKNDDPTKNGGKPWVVGWPFKTADDVLNRISWVESTADFFNVWVCMSQQSECGQKPNGKLKAVRKAANATLLNSVWIDCDVKAGDAKHYGTIQDAWEAIRAFQKKAGLPTPSVVVNSGGGLHIYWTSNKPLTPDEWRPYAEGLKTFLLNEGVLCDAGLTTDIARILRVPDTLNHKYDPPRKVQLIHCGAPYDFAKNLALLCDVAPASVPVTEKDEPKYVIEPGAVFDAPDPLFACLKPDDKLQAGAHTGPTFVDPIPIFVKEGCPWLCEALRTGGKDFDQPQWNLSVLCTAFMEKGNDIAHEISKGHTEYTPADTQALYDRKVAERRDRGVGFPSCRAIKGVGSKHCETCPHFSKGKSPLNIRPAATTADPGGTQTSQSSHRSNTTSGWPDGCSKQGTPIKGYANTLVAIRKLNITCKLDTFRQKEFSEGHAIPSLNGELSDRAVTMLGDQISGTFSFYPGKEILREAITAECSRNAYNPVVDYFDRLTWDGVSRLQKLFHRHLGADDTPLNDAISTKLMCAIVRRSKHPGCKYDHEVVLQGDQGARKSMFCEDLAVFPDLFTDAGDLAGSIKEQMEVAQGKQIIEFAELAGFSQNSRERNKAYLSRRIDRARLAYGHYAKDQPRSSVPIGTTNPGGYLNDPTGERRYWHVAVKAYDREAFLADKDQLYAEAVVLEPNQQLWLDTPELVAAHDAIVATAKEPNTMVEELSDLVGEVWEVGREKTDTGWLIHQEERVSNRQVRAWLRLDGIAHSMRDLGRRISDAMTSLGWTKVPGTLVCKHGGSPEGGYRRPTVDRFEPRAARPGETAEEAATEMEDDTI